MRLASALLGVALVSGTACATTLPTANVVTFPPGAAQAGSPRPQTCREFQQKILIDGKEQSAYGTACRQPDGSWRVVSPATTNPPENSTSNPPSVAVVPVPYPYYYYPAPYAYPYPYPYYRYYWGPRYSFGFGHRGHWRH